MVADDVRTWRCPRCRGPLDAEPGGFNCRACSTPYPVIGGIPDFRIDDAHWVDVSRDRRNALSLLESSSLGAAALIERVFANREGWTAERRAHRVSQVLEGRTRERRELDDWLRLPTSASLPFLDLGCGPGQLLAAGALCGRAGIGIDVSLEWLVVARQLILESGGRPMLAAAMGEALPLADGSVGGVVSLDTIEHVGDQRKYLEEINRVMAPEGVAAFSTPNRYSLSAEPHVGVWGVGWLPRRWQAGYVQRRTGIPYEYCRLLGRRELERIVGAAGLRPKIAPGRIPAEELQRFRPTKAWLADRYNWLLQFRLPRRALLPVSPFLCVLATKNVRAPAIAEGHEQP